MGGKKRDRGDRGEWHFTRCGKDLRNGGCGWERKRERKRCLLGMALSAELFSARAWRDRP
jgi:hypothetical protein